MSTFSSGLNPIYHILFNLLKSQKLEAIIPFIDTLPYIEKLTYGVPQGSILGPIQFLLFINDLPGNVKIAKLVLYADDTNILVVDKDIKVFELKTALVMKQLEGWLLDIELVVNTAKTCAMLLHSSEQKYVDKPNILYHTVTAYSPNIKFLGITLTEILKWNAHIDILCKSLNMSYFMIKS